MHRQQKGFTLFELVMTIVLLGIISVVVGKVLFQSYQTFLTAQNISDADWNALLAMERVANDLHNIRSVNDMSTALSTQFSFVDVSGTSVQYTFSSPTLSRNSQTLASGIQSFSFSYLDKNGTVTSTPSAIRYISFSLSSQNFSVPFASLIAVRAT